MPTSIAAELIETFLESMNKIHHLTFSTLKNKNKKKEKRKGASVRWLTESINHALNSTHASIKEIRLAYPRDGSDQ